MINKLLIYLTLGFLGIFLVGGVLLYEQRNRNTPLPATKAESIRFTIVEGWTLEDIGKNLEKAYKQQSQQNLVTSDEFLKTAQSFKLQNFSLISKKPLNSNLEGFVFPDTYFLPKISPAETNIVAILLQKALTNFENKITPDMFQVTPGATKTLYEVIILASIIEKETGRNTITAKQKQDLEIERKIIAGIFYNRLKIGMPLGSDATINYITKKNIASVSEQDTKINSPYNTYNTKGLPPGPICNPSFSSIDAALNPTSSSYYFFLHKQPSGEVIYSRTFEEHVINKYKYLK